MKEILENKLVNISIKTEKKNNYLICEYSNGKVMIWKLSRYYKEQLFYLLCNICANCKYKEFENEDFK